MRVGWVVERMAMAPARDTSDEEVFDVMIELLTVSAPPTL